MFIATTIGCALGALIWAVFFIDLPIKRTLSDWIKRKKEEKEKKELETALLMYPIKGLPNIETETFEHRVAFFETWRKDHDGSWVPDGASEWGLRYISSSLEDAIRNAGFDSECDRIRVCYKDLEKIRREDLCSSGYRYLAVEFYYASLALKDLVYQIHRLTNLKDLAGDELLPNERLDPVLSELFSGIGLIIERHFESELLELIKMAIVEQLGASNTLQAKLPSGSSCHATTTEEIARLKLLADSILTGSRGDQPVSMSDIYPEENASN